MKQKRKITPLPPGCTEVDSHDDKFKKHYRCPKLGFSVNMELRRCSFQNRRAVLAAHIEKGEHIFDIPRKNDDLFPEKICISNKVLSQDQIQHSIMRALAILCTSLNISSKKAVSDRMEEFIHYLLDVGIQIKTNFKNQSLNVEDIFHMKNINKMGEYINVVADEVCKNAIPFFKERYVSLQMDSGTVSKLKVVHYIISIPESKTTKPFLYDLIENKNFDSLKYSIATNSVLAELFDNNIYVSAIIVDNLRCQTKGLEIIKTASENPLVKSVFIVHCFCHMTSLVFVNVLNHNMHLNNLVNSIKSIVTILRKNTSTAFIGKKCPSIVETRWLYIYDILIFIQRFKNEVITILKGCEEVELEAKLPEILELIQIIKPLRLFCDAMEKNYSISAVGHYVKEVIEYFQKQNFLFVQDIFEDIFTNFIARIQSNNFDLVVASYFLSSSGRAYFRNRYKKSVTYSPNEDKYYKYPSILEAENNLQNEIEIDDATFKIILENSFNKTNSEEADLFTTEPANEASQEEISSLFTTYNEKYEQLKQKNFKDILSIDLFSNMILITENVLSGLANSLEIEINNIHELLNIWAFDSTDALPFMKDLEYLPPVELWKRIIPFEDWEIFGEIVLRIMSIATSESDCERFISKQRYVAGDHGTNFSIKSMKSRLQVISDSSLIDI